MSKYTNRQIDKESVPVLKPFPLHLTLTHHPQEFKALREFFSHDFRNASITVNLKNSTNSSSGFFELLIDAVKHCEVLTIIPYYEEDLARNFLIPLSFPNLRKLSLHTLKPIPPISLKGLTKNLLAFSLIDCSVGAA